MTKYIESFKPIMMPDSKVLILGSMPSVESLKRQEYYGNSSNVFWKILFELFEEPFSSDYEKRIEMLKKNQIALWDVLSSCRREGSLDSQIKNESINDFEWLFNELKEIKCVFFNGKKAFNSYAKYFGFIENSNIKYYILPSTSAAHAIKYEKKLKEWEQIKECL
ncbi:MAG: DNA-deoxyinosine glycosylase [Clostridiales bacterium]|nr:DNA-deoxyinosine glycosylase [Clostridiales bacterium]